ncbi:MAG: 16S rRNA (uracil(1498)-N(3))-methyltransferase [Thermodesulfobacteriota bacterium]
MRRFLIEQAPDRKGRLRLHGAEAHHARNVLRLGPGASVVLADGEGREYLARILAVDREGIDLEVLEERPDLAEPRLALTLGLGLLKADRMDLVVQKTTELGLKTLVPLRTARGESRLQGARAAARLERWNRISRQALKQCRRRQPLEIHAVTDLAGFLAASSPADLKIMLYEGTEAGPDNWRLICDRRPRPEIIWALVGPEGGFTPDEVYSARQADFEILGLGPRILRAETAALALTSILGFEFGDFS